ncbi:protection of telomeres protein 1b isoform X1 [Ziziphus jujuba]|uniref:Protection of telomeres protein 1b isoform X1 n=2 Tax=Ziziphus jujuba TaxID=326968 RepID=A0A6P4A3W4_ZIZJJ|nr:protection of telomeres protein 1b isoform X1 [Ziziphus jujuba]
MRGRDDYKFLEIRDAIASINQKVSLIGVIAEFDFPKKTKGTDFLCTVKIVDESHQDPGLQVRVFEENEEKLPHIASTGDIIQFNHVVMKTHHGDLFAVFNKKISSFALYDGKDSDNFLPYQVSPKFQRRDLDAKFITGLRKWVVNFQIDGGSDDFSLLREIKEGERVNVVCKIVHVCEVDKDKWMAFVWDGTDTRPACIPTRLEDEKDHPLPLHLEPLPLPRDVLCTLPQLGTVLRVIFSQGIEKHCLHLLKTGYWVKFVNVLFEVEGGLWRGVLTPFTKLRYTPNEDSLVLERQRIYDLRLSSRSLLARLPFFSFPCTSRITEVGHKDVPCVTLMDVLTYSEVTAKFMCVVRVVAVLPWQPEDFYFCGTYRIRLTLEDPTARIYAYLYAEDGEKFFGGYPTADVLTRKRNVLLGMTAADDNGKETEGAARNPPWIHCCLKSYYLTKSDPWGSRHYRIFGTKLVV